MVIVALALDDRRKFNEEIKKILEIKKMRETMASKPLLKCEKIFNENE